MPRDRNRSRSPPSRRRWHSRSRSRSRSPPSTSRRTDHRSTSTLDAHASASRHGASDRYEDGGRRYTNSDDVRRTDDVDDGPKAVEKANFGLTGALTEDLNTGNVYRGVVMKWSEPPEARVPSRKWRLHVFKNDKQLEKPLHIHRQSAFLVGREKRIADVLVEHPSCSKQHAVIQYRYVDVKSSDGVVPQDGPKRTVKPYILDLNSTNGTYVNGEQVPSQRYVELKAGDMIQFGHSTREYVLLHDKMI